MHHGITIEAGIKKYLEAVEATKGAGNTPFLQNMLERGLSSHITKHLVYRLDRNDLLGLFAAGRKEGLNQKTINKRVTVVLNMVRHLDHDIKLKKGDWPKTTQTRRLRSIQLKRSRSSSLPAPMMSVCCL
jgi:hypothetical protein